MCPARKLKKPTAKVLFQAKWRNKSPIQPKTEPRSIVKAKAVKLSEIYIDKTATQTNNDAHTILRQWDLVVLFGQYSFKNNGVKTHSKTKHKAKSIFRIIFSSSKSILQIFDNNVTDKLLLFKTDISCTNYFA